MMKRSLFFCLRPRHPLRYPRETKQFSCCLQNIRPTVSSSFLLSKPYFILPQLSCRQSSTVPANNSEQCSGETVNHVNPIENVSSDSHSCMVPVNNYEQCSSEIPDSSSSTIENGGLKDESVSLPRYTPEQSCEAVDSIISTVESVGTLRDLKRMRQILDERCQCLHRFNDDDIILLLQTLDKFYSPTEFGRKHLHYLLYLIDRECIYRAADWNPTEFVAFLKKYNLPCTAKSDFMFYALNRRFSGVFSSDLVTILEYMKIMHDAPVWRVFKGSKFDLEDVLKKSFHNLTLETLEWFLKPIAVIEGHLVSDRLKKNMSIKLIEEFDNVSNSLLKTYLQIFCKQAKISRNFLFITPWLLRLLKRLNARIDDFDLECVQYAALLCTKLYIYDVDLLEYLARKLPECKTLPEIECTLYPLVYFNYRPELYPALIQRLREEPLSVELQKRPKSLFQILYQLSIVGHYPEDLLNTFFSPATLKKLRPKGDKMFKITAEMHALHGGIKVECPDYQGNTLPNKFLSAKKRELVQDLPKELKEHPFIENVNSSTMSTCLNSPRTITPYFRALYCTRGILDSLFGNADCTHVCCVLRHFSKANVLFCLDDSKKPQKIPEEVRNSVLINRNMLDKNLNWYVVAFQSHNRYTESEPRPMGHDIPKIRQMKRLGYNVIVVTRHGWLNTSIEEKISILKKGIFAGSENYLEMYEKFS